MLKTREMSIRNFSEIQGLRDSQTCLTMCRGRDEETFMPRFCTGVVDLIEIHQLKTGKIQLRYQKF